MEIADGSLAAFLVWFLSYPSVHSRLVFKNYICLFIHLTVPFFSFSKIYTYTFISSSFSNAEKNSFLHLFNCHWFSSLFIYQTFRNFYLFIYSLIACLCILWFMHTVIFIFQTLWNLYIFICFVYLFILLIFFFDEYINSLNWSFFFKGSETFIYPSAYLVTCVYTRSRLFCSFSKAEKPSFMLLFVPSFACISSLYFMHAFNWSFFQGW